MLPINPRLPPPYTRCMFRFAMTRPNSFAASMNSGLLPGLDPQKTKIRLIRYCEVDSIFLSYLDVILDVLKREMKC